MSSKHLTLEQRYLIGAYKESKKQNEIARMIGVHPSTISRELKRGRGEISQKGYWPVASHQRAIQAQKEKSHKANLKLTEKTKTLIHRYLSIDYSPEQIAAMLHIKHDIQISPVTLYAYIHQDKLDGGILYTHLRHQGKRRHKYRKAGKNRIKGRISIDHRPPIVDQKSRVGDFEADTIIGKGRDGAIVTLVERHSMYTKISLPITKKATIVAQEMVRLLAPFKRKVHTITTDNGLEFAQHQSVSRRLGCEYYFCHPYSSWQRGLNENINGLIRQYIPKGSSFAHLTHKEIQRIENRLNHRPRKSLGWRTPHEVFHEKLKAS
jgi:IS30 family transposase